MKKLRVALMMRGSTNKQSSKGKLKKQLKSGKISARPISIEDDLPVQKKTIEAFINSQPEKNKNIEWEMTDLEFVEITSGFHTHTSKRKGLQDAFESAKRGEFDILVLFKLDRFGRRSAESLDMAVKFLRYCRIWVVDKGAEFKSEGSIDEIQNFIEFWAAKKASEDTKVRVEAAMKLIHQEGFWTGGNPPYGFENHPEEPNMLKVIPTEAAIVKEIFNLYVDNGFGYTKIAAHLNEKGLKSKTGRNWSSHTIMKIISNTVYKGHLSYGKTKVVEGEFGAYQKRLINGGTVSDKYWAEYDIVGKDIWEKAQDLKAKKMKPNMFGGKSPSKAATGKGALVGILKCECGGHMTYGTCSDWADSKRTHKKEPYGIYRCQTRLKQGVKACGAKKATYRVEQLEKDIIDELFKKTSNMVQSKVINKMVEKAKSSTADIKEKIDSYKQDVKQLATAKKNINDKQMELMMGLDNGFNPEQLTEMYNTTIEKLEIKEKELVELEALRNTDDLNEIDQIKLEEFILAWRKIFDFGTAHQKRNLIASLVNSIQVTKDAIYFDAALDMKKFVESISAIKETAAAEIAASVDNIEDSNDNPYLHNVNGGCPDGTHNTSMEILLDSEEINILARKLSKVFTNKITNEFIITA